ncbi:MAG: nickel-dependent hydrogenase large subunit, partial [Acidobacteriota bacterium]|nr:nickel-dependent hydrogenase large subunit [Acidobacteriota bacterium]
RLLVGYAKDNKEIKEVVDEALTKLEVPVAALFSTLGRTAARGLETRLIVRWLKEFYDELIGNLKTGEMSTFTREKWEPETWPAECEGVGLSEAPRGALAHWIRIKDRKIENYQMVVPSTWNASPRDGKGQRSAYEESLIDTPVARENEPLEIIRTIHSFDPCLACAVHLYDPDGKTLHQVTVN